MLLLREIARLDPTLTYHEFTIDLVDKPAWLLPIVHGDKEG